MQHQEIFQQILHLEIKHNKIIQIQVEIKIRLM